MLKKLMLSCLLALLALGGNVDASRIRTIVEVDGVQTVTYDNGGTIVTPPPPVGPPIGPPVVLPPPTTLPAGAKLIPWTAVAQQTPIQGPVAVHIPVPAGANGIVRVFIELSTSAPTLPTGSLYGGVDRRTADGGGVVQWSVRMGDVAAPGQSQGFAGQDLIVNVEDAELLNFQFQWYPT